MTPIVQTIERPARPGLIRLEWLGLAFMVAITLITRLPFLGHPAPDYDEQLYSLIGQQMLHGQLPYVDLWDRKPIGLFLLFAAAHAMGGEQPAAYQIMAMGFCLIGGWLSWRLARRITEPATAAFASALFPLLMAIYGSHAGQSEIFYVPMIMAMAELVMMAVENRQDLQPENVALIPAQMVAAMCCGGLALQVKYSVLPQCLWFGLFSLGQRHRLRMPLPRLIACAALFGFLGALPTLLAALFYLHAHAFDAFVFANFVSIRYRATMPARYALAKQLVYLMPLTLLAAGGLLQALRLKRGKLPLAYWQALGWLLTTVASLFMGTTIYPYYYAALAPATILIALPMFDRRAPLGPVILGGVIVWLLTVYNPPKLFADARRERVTLARMAAKLTPYVGSKSHCLYVYDGPIALYRLTNSGLPTRIIYPDHLNNQLEAHALPVDPVSEVQRIFAEQPGAVVTSKQPVTLRNEATYRVVGRQLALSYTAIGSLYFQDRWLDLYARRGAMNDRLPGCADHR